MLLGKQEGILDSSLLYYTSPLYNFLSFDALSCAPALGISWPESSCISFYFCSTFAIFLHPPPLSNIFHSHFIVKTITVPGFEVQSISFLSPFQNVFVYNFFNVMSFYKNNWQFSSRIYLKQLKDAGAQELLFSSSLLLLIIKKIICIATHERRCKIEFWPHWISTRGVLIQRAVLRIQRIFHVELRPPETGGHCITTPPTDKIWTPRLIVTLGLDSTLNFDPRS